MVLHEGQVRRIEIVVLNWNGYRDTARCLESLALLEAPENAEIRVRVVDNGSTDGSAEELPGRFGWALFLANDKNLRYAGGNNVGIGWHSKRALILSCFSTTTRWSIPLLPEIC